ncbi:uncharacterized protein LOC120420101 [Culex pipiens pallens]|uniref:uncharacterized protein LOC120420101 n=1 Tax=Culex pipiens pallens TaxID=42434 RepID=UPI001952A8D8|nr:uncharacterized protein LOC120420101 [Culex pipiens pallens]XP_039438983.1 uncharacterized protein LOC120420101 [Culex pipiens pallens]
MSSLEEPKIIVQSHHGSGTLQPKTSLQRSAEFDSTAVGSQEVIVASTPQAASTPRAAGKSRATDTSKASDTSQAAGTTHVDVDIPDAGLTKQLEKGYLKHYRNEHSR